MSGSSNHQSCTAVARVKKIIAMDEDIAQCSNSAAFVISIATVSMPSSYPSGVADHVEQEMFIRQLTEQAHNVVKSEKKPRRNLQYKDFGKTTTSALDPRADITFQPMPLPELTTLNSCPM